MRSVRGVFKMRLIFSVMVIVVMLIITSGCTRNSLPLPGSGNPFPGGDTAAAGSGQVPLVATSGKVIAAYFYLYPDPDDDTYPLVMSAKDRIPWKQVNRIYIGFATVNNGILTDLPAADSADDAARRAETQDRIRNVVALCREANPEAEIFIVSNFGDELDPEYLAAAEDPQKFADSVIAYLKEYDLDGYDMDWESRQIDDYAPQLTSLLSACHERFAGEGNSPGGRRFLLTHTVWPGVESADTVSGLRDSVDQINIMSYGPGDTYDLSTYASAYNNAGFPYEKMIGGIESESGYGESGGHDTQESITAKCSFVKVNHLAGLFEWRMDNDMRPEGMPPSYRVTGWMSSCLAG
jgi:GH18 family chitinase